MRIGQFAAAAGVSASAARYYERLGLLPEPARRGGKRDYRTGDVARLKAIVAARQAGFRICEIQPLLAAANDRVALQVIASRKLRQLDDDATRLRAKRNALAMLSACPCRDAFACEQVEILSRRT